MQTKKSCWGLLIASFILLGGCSDFPLSSESAGTRTVASHMGFQDWVAPENLVCNEQAPLDILIRKNMFKRDRAGKVLQTYEAQKFFVGKLEKSIYWRTRVYGEADDTLAAAYAQKVRLEESKKDPADRLAVLPVRSSVVSSSFMGKPILMHKKIMPAIKCVEQEIQNNCQKPEFICDAYDSNGYCTKNHEEIYKANALSTLRDKNSYVGGEISNHMYGIAMDIDPNRNPCCGCTGDWPNNARCSWKVPEVMRSDLPDCWIESFKKYGFYWLGEDDMGDTMHFEFLGDPDKIIQ